MSVTRATRSLPDGYREAGSIDLKKDNRALVVLNLLGVALLLAFGVLFILAAGWLRPAASAWISFSVATIPQALVTIAWLLAITVVMLALHEAIHGVFFWLFTGVRPVFGLGPGYAYAAAPEWYMPRGQYFVVGLAPLVVISVGCLVLLALAPLSWTMGIIAFATFNASGAVGDLAVAAWLLRLPASALANDRGDAVHIFLPANQ